MIYDNFLNLKTMVYRKMRQVIKDDGSYFQAFALIIYERNKKQESWYHAIVNVRRKRKHMAIRALAHD